MRFAVMSDLHGNLAATRSVFEDIDGLERSTELTFCAGDVVGHAPHPNEVIDLLRSHRVEVVRGNYDEFVSGARTSSGVDYVSEHAEDVDLAAMRWTRDHLTPENAAYLQNLHREARMLVTGSGRGAVKKQNTDERVNEYRRDYFVGAIFGGFALKSSSRRQRAVNARRVLVIHGSPRDTVEYLYPGLGQSVFRTVGQDAQADVIIHGHTHQAFEQVVGEVAFIGVGSVGRSPLGAVAEYALIDIAGSQIDIEFKRVPYDVEREARDIELSGLPLELADSLRAPAAAPSGTE